MGLQDLVPVERKLPAALRDLCVRDYFYHARCVDMLSQLHYAYLPGRKAQRSWPRLAWWLLDMCVINAFQLRSIGQDRPSQLRFREELMHELLKQLPAEQKPQRRSRRRKAADSLTKDQYPEHTHSRGDCAACSNRSRKRATSRVICAKCGGHLCLSACFSWYPSDV
jgi:hypothetical protein